MARRVFFSFHYARDVRRIQQVRQSWVMRPGGEAQPFYDAAAFEQAKQRAGGIAKWIEEQLAGTSVTVVLFGAETYNREWVKHEIKRSHELGKGLVAIDIHRIRDPQHGADAQGLNPFGHWNATVGTRSVPFTNLYRTYDWANDNGFANMPAWIEAAARAAGR